MSIEHRLMSPLRQRMIEDMTLRKLAEKTQSGYLRWVRDFARLLGRAPDSATGEDLRRYQLHRSGRLLGDERRRSRRLLPEIERAGNAGNAASFSARRPRVPRVG